MRSFSGDIITKSAQTNQTIAADADPYVSLRIARAHTILDNMDLTEKVRVRRTDPNTITDADVAVQHPRFKGENSKIWVAYIRNGKLNVRWTYDRENITEMSWNGISTGKDAIACAIAFNSQVVENARGYAEFVSIGEYPYIFYVDPDGALHYLMLGGVILDEVLALENVTDVSAVRGPSAKYGNWDLGLTVFFLMNGVLFYRQCIEGIWYDAEQVNIGIPDETIIKIDAFNTWDYRVGVQCLTQSGKLYQIITYTEGIGVRGTNHIDAIIRPITDLIGITYHNEYIRDHISMSVGMSIQSIYGLSAVPISVRNIEDEDENWGTTIQVTFDISITDNETTVSMFGLTDTDNNIYYCNSYSLGEEGRVLTLVFDDFNLAEGLSDNTLTLTYTKPENGGLMSPATQTNSFILSITPTGLVAPPMDPPTYLSATNNNAGEVITLHLTEAAINESFSDMLNNFSITMQEYNFVPNGTLVTVSRNIASIISDGTDVDMSGATLNDAMITNGVITLEVDSDG